MRPFAIGPTTHCVAVSVCTANSQIFGYGNHNVNYCIQSCSKTVAYAKAVVDKGLEKVHKHVGREASSTRSR